MSHFKIFVDVITLILGSGVAVALFQRRTSRHGLALRALALFVIFHNLLVLGDLGYRYYLANITGHDLALFSSVILAGLVAIRVTADAGCVWFLLVAARRLTDRRPTPALLALLLAAALLVFGLGIVEINAYDQSGSIAPLAKLLQVWILVVLGLIVSVLASMMGWARSIGAVEIRRSVPMLATLLLLAYAFVLTDELNFYYFEIGDLDPGNLPMLAVNLSVLAWMRFWLPPSWKGRPALQETSLEDLGKTFGISVREREVIEQLLAGKNNKEIQEALFISPSTVKNHLTNIYRKLGVDSRTRLIAFLRDPARK